MSLIRSYTSSLPVLKLHNEIDRLFRDLSLDTFSEDQEEVGPSFWIPKMDVSEFDDYYVVDLDLPGMTKGDIAVKVQDGRLVVSGERKESSENQEKNYHRIERSFGRFFRAVTLPTGVDANGVGAEFHDGVLTIKVRKTNQKKPQRIEIR